MKFIHLTDTHFVPNDRTLYGLSPRVRLAPAIEDINRHHRDAAFVMITGDLAHWGEAGAYRDLRAELDRLEIPYRLVLGNHDRREIFRETFPEAPSDPNGFLQYAFETPAGWFVVLDTLEHGTHAGHLCERRLTWLSAQLEACGGRPVYLFLHHPPLHVGIPSMDAISLVQRDELARVLAPHANIRHMFFGHVHRPIHGTWRGIPFSTHRAINHQVGFDLVEAAVIPGSHEPPAYAVVLLAENEVIIHVHDYLDGGPRFALSDKAAVAARTPEEIGRRLEPA